MNITLDPESALSFDIEISDEEKSVLKSAYGAPNHGLISLNKHLKRRIRGFLFLAGPFCNVLVVKVLYSKTSPDTPELLSRALQEWFAKGRVFLKCKEAISK